MNKTDDATLATFFRLIVKTGNCSILVHLNPTITMKKLMLVMLMAFAFITTQAQRGIHRPGEISVGVRSTNSLFSGHSGPGVGFGGQMRLRLLEYVNTEWFADYITSGIGSVGNRTDYHIGWSVLFYPPFAYTENRPLKLQPFFIAGHCFDYTRVTSNNPWYVAEESRWSSAVQGGLGFHLPFTERFDFSMTAQYMMHLGMGLHTEERTATNGDKFLYVDEANEAGLEGHLLVTWSINYRFADLWKKKIKGVQDKKPIDKEEDKVGY